MLLLVDVTFYTHIGTIRLTRFHPGSVDRNSHKGKISDVHIGQIYHCVRSGILELQCIGSQIRLVQDRDAFRCEADTSSVAIFKERMHFEQIIGLLANLCFCAVMTTTREPTDVV